MKTVEEIIAYMEEAQADALERFEKADDQEEANFHMTVAKTIEYLLGEILEQ